MATLSQRNFAAGELSPSLHSRCDVVQYQTGLKTARNVLIGRFGGAISRPGTGFVAEVKDSTKPVRLIDFTFSSAQTCVLELGDLYLRVHQNGAPLLETAVSITGVTKASPGVVTTSANHNYQTGDDVRISGVSGMTELNGRTFTVGAVTATTFELKVRVNGAFQDVSTTGFATYTSGGLVARIYTLAAPWAAADLPELNYAQSADVITVVHTKYNVHEIRRLSASAWQIAIASYGPKLLFPTNLQFNGATPAGGGLTWKWVVTALTAEGEESPPSDPVFLLDGTTISPTAQVKLTWNAVANAVSYNVYRALNGAYGLVGSAVSATTPQFIDIGAQPDYSSSPPIVTSRWTPTPLPAATGWPALVAYFQQRLVVGGGTLHPQLIFASRTGALRNFSYYRPTLADDAIAMTVVGQKVGQVIHAADVGGLVVFTTEGEFRITGDTFTPTSGIKQVSSFGATRLRPIVIGESALFVQNTGSQVRDLNYDMQVENYRGNELSIYAGHLVDGYQINDWCYQKAPHSIVWMARSDGTLLGLTYVREQQVLGWHRHDTDGFIENVCSVREGNEDRVYMVVRRTAFDGSVRRIIERMHSRSITDQVAYPAMDSSVSRSALNQTATTLTVTASTPGQTNAGDSVVVTSSTAYFQSTDVGRRFEVLGADNRLVRFELKTVGTSQLAAGVLLYASESLIVGPQTSATWYKLLTEVRGLQHLEGKAVSILGDGFVVASPLNSSYPLRVVSGGKVSLGGHYRTVHVGLPFTADLETLDIDTPQGETLANKKMIVNKVIMRVEGARGLYIGSAAPVKTPLEGLTELKPTYPGDALSPIALKTAKVDVVIRSEWNSNGRVFVRQVDPLPFTILSVHPEGSFPIRG